MVRIVWVIQFGYTPSLENPQDEEERVADLLNKSTRNEYRYGNDADDMRSPGKAIDPRIMISDMSDDPIGVFKQRMDIIRSIYPDLMKKFEVPGESYHAFRDAFSILNSEYKNNVKIISRYVGGVYMDRSMVGQDGKEDPFIPVPLENKSGQ